MMWKVIRVKDACIVKGEVSDVRVDQATGSRVKMPRE
jgi:hypothetical protein